MLLVAGLTLCDMVGVEPAVPDAAILDRLDDGARQTAAGAFRGAAWWIARGDQPAAGPG